MCTPSVPPLALSMCTPSVPLSIRGVTHVRTAGVTTVRSGALPTSVPGFCFSSIRSGRVVTFSSLALEDDAIPSQEVARWCFGQSIELALGFSQLGKPPVRRLAFALDAKTTVLSFHDEAVVREFR